MSTHRALFASVGASMSLVAAAAVALLAVSAVFAFGGAGGDLQSYGSQDSLVLDVAAAPGSGQLLNLASASQPVVIRPPARRAAPVARTPDRAQGRPTTIAAPGARAAVRPQVRTPAAVLSVTPRPTAPPAVAAVAPRTGDAVRRVGDDVSSTVQTTGTKLSDATAPLGPPVSQAVQKVLDQIAVLLKRTTDGLGGTLDKVLPKP